MRKYKFRASNASDATAFLRLNNKVLKGGKLEQDLLHADVIVTLLSTFPIDQLRNQMMGVDGSRIMIKKLVEIVL